MTDKGNRVKFFEKTFLVAIISPEVVLEMLFFTLSNTDIDFLDWELRWRTYTIKKTFPTTKHIELVEKEEFAAAAFDSKHKTFVVYIASLFATSLSFTPLNVDIYLLHKPQIVELITKEASTNIFNEYADFTDVFFSTLMSKLPKYTEINNNAIKLVNGQQLPYKTIDSLRTIELETLKAYMETIWLTGLSNHPNHL